jgi:hypothetical protein
MTLAFLLDAACPAATANPDGSGPQPPTAATVTVTSYLMGGSVMPLPWVRADRARFRYRDQCLRADRQGDGEGRASARLGEDLDLALGLGHDPVDGG